MDKENIPRHIAIIPDGNRRWAKQKGLLSIDGYKTIGYNHLEELFLCLVFVLLTFEGLPGSVT